MILLENVLKLAERIAELFDPEKIILFGSYAYGTPREDSDIDLLVIMNTDSRPVRKAIEICRALQYDFPMDLLVRTPEDIERRYKGCDPLICYALDKGKVLYERTGINRPGVAS